MLCVRVTLEWLLQSLRDTCNTQEVSWECRYEVDADVIAGGVEKPGLVLDVLHGKLLYLDWPPPVLSSLAGWKSRTRRVLFLSRRDSRQDTDHVIIWRQINIKIYIGIILLFTLNSLSVKIKWWLYLFLNLLTLTALSYQDWSPIFKKV